MEYEERRCEVFPFVGYNHEENYEKSKLEGVELY